VAIPNPTAGAVVPIPKLPPTEVRVVVAIPVPRLISPPETNRSPATSVLDNEINVVKSPAAAVVCPIGVLLIVPPSIVRASTTSAF